MVVAFVGFAKSASTKTKLNVKHINEALKVNGIVLDWASILNLTKRDECKMEYSDQTRFLVQTIEGKDSGVVVDNGTRTVYQLSFKDAQYKGTETHQVDLRFSLDRIEISNPDELIKQYPEFKDFIKEGPFSFQ